MDVWVVGMGVGVRMAAMTFGKVGILDSFSFFLVLGLNAMCVCVVGSLGKVIVEGVGGWVFVE